MTPREASERCTAARERLGALLDVFYAAESIHREQLWPGVRDAMIEYRRAIDAVIVAVELTRLRGRS